VLHVVAARVEPIKARNCIRAASQDSSIMLVALTKMSTFEPKVTLSYVAVFARIFHPDEIQVLEWKT
jgi:hypothetical protein